MVQQTKQQIIRTCPLFKPPNSISGLMEVDGASATREVLWKSKKKIILNICEKIIRIFKYGTHLDICKCLSGEESKTNGTQIQTFMMEAN